MEQAELVEAQRGVPLDERWLLADELGCPTPATIAQDPARTILFVAAGAAAVILAAAIAQSVNAGNTLTRVTVAGGSGTQRVRPLACLRCACFAHRAETGAKKRKPFWLKLCLEPKWHQAYP